MNRNPLKFQRKEGIKKIEKVVGGVYYIWQTDRLQPPPITGGKKKKKKNSLHWVGSNWNYQNLMRCGTTREESSHIVSMVTSGDSIQF